MKYEDIKIGDVFDFDKVVSEKNVHKFADLSGDVNKIHVDRKYGQDSKYGKNIAHGMLLGSFFSTIIGMHCPGENSLYVSQSLNFRKPCFYGDKITVRGTVIKMNDSIKMITIKTEIIKEGEVLVFGEAKALVTK